MWTFDPSVQAPYDVSLNYTFYSNLIRITVEIVPSSWVVQVFDFFSVMMWVLSVAFFVATFSTRCMKEREREIYRSVTLSLLGAAVTLLFALPIVRSLWPVAPPLGVVAKDVSIYGPVAIVALSTACLLLQVPLIAIYSYSKVGASSYAKVRHKYP